MRRLLFILAFILAVLSRGGAQIVDFRTSQTCYGGMTTLVSTASVRDSIVLYLWDLNGDGSFYDAIGDSVTYIFPLPGYQNVGHKIITLDNQSKAIYKQVAIGGISADFSFEDACIGNTTSFHNESVVYADTAFFFTWNFGDGSAVSNEENPVHLYTSAMTYNVMFSVVTTGGCQDSVEKSLTIDDPPVINLVFSGDTTFPVGDSIIVAVQGSFESVQWSTGDYTTTIVIHDPGYYWVEASLGNCSARKGFTVRTQEYDNEPVVAGLITPNGDGFNDTWEVLNLVKVKPCEVHVFNKRGESVFSSGAYSNDWDGTYKGKQLSNDTYYYTVRCYDGKLFRGTVNILK